MSVVPSDVNTLCSLFVLGQGAGSFAVNKAVGAHRLSATEQAHQGGDTASPGILLRGGQVEQHISLEQRSRWVMNGKQLVVQER